MMSPAANALQSFILRLKGGRAAPPRADFRDIAWSGLGGMVAIGLVALLTLKTGVPAVMAPLGASCFLVFAAPDSPFAQPRNVIGGHLVSSLVGLLLYAALGSGWWVMALAVGLAIIAMQLSRTGHPPAGADPLVVLAIHPDWMFLITPVLLGSLVVVGTAVLFNNLRPGFAYPKYWRG
jgi:CBS-domain-containing membrane protein